MRKGFGEASRTCHTRDPQLASRMFCTLRVTGFTLCEPQGSHSAGDEFHTLRVTGFRISPARKASYTLRVTSFTLCG
jgi:hypothetical protein